MYEMFVFEFVGGSMARQYEIPGGHLTVNVEHAALRLLAAPGL